MARAILGPKKSFIFGEVRKKIGYLEIKKNLSEGNIKLIISTRNVRNRERDETNKKPVQKS
jgi:hypothetical protein